jgi:hypothetical protein
VTAYPDFIVRREPHIDPDMPAYLRVKCRRCTLSWLIPQDEHRRHPDHPKVLTEHAATHSDREPQPLKRGAFIDATGEPTDDPEQGFWSRRADELRGIEDALALVERPADRMHAASFIETAMLQWGTCQIIVRKKSLELRRNTAAKGKASCLNGRGPMVKGETEMGIGKRRLDFMPSAKWDAKAGRFFVFNRVQVDGQWTTQKQDVTEDFAAIFDLPNVQTGWIRFPEGAAPETKLGPAAEDKDLGPPPSKDFKQGLRIIIRIDGDDAGAREVLNTSAAFWNAIDALHDEYLAGVEDRPGQLPVVGIGKVLFVETANGTSATPVFTILEWTPRPADMPKLLAPRSEPKRKDDGMSDSIPF